MILRVVLAFLLGVAAFAQDSGAPVMFEGREILRVYGSFGPYSAEDRTKDVAARLTGMAERGEIQEVAATYISVENATAITNGRSLIMMVLQADAQASGKTQEKLAGNKSTHSLSARRRAPTLSSPTLPQMCCRRA